jgi:transcriptional regulator with XRE-family HTH domain
MDYKKTIVKNIKKYCSLRDITYSELARKANIPLTTLQAILYDERYKEPRLSNAHSIAKALQISLDDLIK